MHSQYMLQGCEDRISYCKASMTYTGVARYDQVQTRYLCQLNFYHLGTHGRRAFQFQYRVQKIYVAQVWRSVDFQEAFCELHVQLALAVRSAGEPDPDQQPFLMVLPFYTRLDRHLILTCSPMIVRRNDDRSWL